MDTVVDSTMGETDSIQLNDADLGLNDGDLDYSKERSERNSTSQGTSLRLKHLLNRCMRRWNKDLEADEQSESKAENKGANAATGEELSEEVRSLHRMAREDILELWNTAVEFEKEVIILHEELEQSKVNQEEFEEEAAALQAQTRQLQETLQRTQVFYKGKLKGAEHQLDETERRLLETPVGSSGNRHADSAEPQEESEVEERHAEMYHELMKANEEVNRLQAERSSAKNQITNLKAQLDENKNSDEELASMIKKHEVLKTRVNHMQTRLSKADEDTEALTESLVEAEGRIEEYENVIVGHRQCEEELTRHLDALRRINSTLTPDEEVQEETQQTFDLFAELQRAQTSTTIGAVQRSGTGMYSARQKLSEMSKASSKAETEVPSNVRKLLSTSVDGSGVHIHLHQHYHNHSHRHHHQHDHLHQADPATDGSRQENFTSARKDVSRVMNAVRGGRAAPLNTEPAPDSPLSGAEREKNYYQNCRAYADVGMSNGVHNGGGDPTIPNVKTFAHATTKFKGRTSNHSGHGNENLATVFYDSMAALAADKDAERGNDGN